MIFTDRTEYFNGRYDRGASGRWGGGWDVNSLEFEGFKGGEFDTFRRGTISVTSPIWWKASKGADCDPID